MVSGTVYEYNFRNADDPIKKRIWKERIAPYMDTANYPSVCYYILMKMRTFM